ncbi:MAG: quinone-dependent dihydroorotate dehydrogenase [Polyangiales bacterium]
MQVEERRAPTATSFYERCLRPILYLFPAELAHRWTFFLLRFFCAIPWARRLLTHMTTVADDRLTVNALGLRFSNPVGLAAGFDKNAEGYNAIFSLGFGSVEVGTITGEPQPGNPRPRLFRLPADAALINRMGFNNDGAAEARSRLQRNRAGIVGVNIGKTKLVEPENAIDDYKKSTELLCEFADYLVVNVSSPNTPGLRDLQAVHSLRPLLVEVRATADRVCESALGPNRVNKRRQSRVPLLLKIAPDLANEDIDAIVDLALELGLDGIIATNTTISRGGLRTDPKTVEQCGAGGLSGRPLASRALQVLQRIRARAGDGLVLVSAGGIDSADEAWARIVAGANLVQVYTGFVYRGPFLVREINRGLSRKLDESGITSIEAASSASA